MKKSALALGAAAMMIAAPLAAADRSSAPIANGSEIGADNEGTIPWAIFLGVVAAGVLILLEGFEGDDDPVSP